MPNDDGKGGNCYAEEVLLFERSPQQCFLFQFYFILLTGCIAGVFFA
jgi:hypothetical protein